MFFIDRDFISSTFKLTKFSLGLSFAPKEISIDIYFYRSYLSFGLNWGK